MKDYMKENFNELATIIKDKISASYIEV